MAVIAANRSKLNQPRFKSLEVTVGIGLNVSILFGLEVSVEAMVHSFAEVLMDNPFIYVWGGVAFLGGPRLGTLPLPIQTRD